MTCANTASVIQPIDLTTGSLAVTAGGAPMQAGYRNAHAPKLIYNINASYDRTLAERLRAHLVPTCAIIALFSATPETVSRQTVDDFGTSHWASVTPGIADSPGFLNQIFRQEEIVECITEKSFTIEKIALDIGEMMCRSG